MRSTVYTKQDVDEARSGLKLLKSRMSESGKRGFGGSSHSANRGYDVSSQHSRPQLNRRNNFGGQSANKPPMPMMPSQQMSMQGDPMPPMGAPTGSNQSNSHYRKAFKPILPGSNSAASNEPSPGLRPGVKDTSYEPERRSPNIVRRQLSTNRKSDGPPHMSYS